MNNTDIYVSMIRWVRWPETGFLREYFVTGEDMGKNPVSKDCGWPETGFLREYFVTGEEMGKNPVSLMVRE